MQAVARNGNERKFVKVVFILPNTVHRSILLSTEVNVVLERNVYIYKAFGKLAKMNRTFFVLFPLYSRSIYFLGLSQLLAVS